MNTTVGQVSAQALTVEQFKKALPEKMKKSVSVELLDQVNALLSDPDMGEHYSENLVSYTSVMADGKFQISQYVSAVKYVSHKLLGCSNIDAYGKTFPDKIMDFVARGIAPKDIASYSTAYNKSKLVNLIFAQTLVPSHVLNNHMFQAALNVQADLMMSANSEKVRSDAANSILTHLKQPETQKIELEVGVKGDSSIDALRATTLALVAQQQRMLQTGGMTVGELARSKLVIEGEVVTDV